MRHGPNEWPCQRWMRRVRPEHRIWVRFYFSLVAVCLGQELPFVACKMRPLFQKVGIQMAKWRVLERAV